MDKKVEMKLLVHPNDYEIAMNAAQLLKTSIEDFCLMAMVRRAAEEVRIAQLQQGCEDNSSISFGDRQRFFEKLVFLAFPDLDSSEKPLHVHRSIKSDGGVR
jgi:hypothetical protein